MAGGDFPTSKSSVGLEIPGQNLVLSLASSPYSSARPIVTKNGSTIKLLIFPLKSTIFSQLWRSLRDENFLEILVWQLSGALLVAGMQTLSIGGGILPSH